MSKQDKKASPNGIFLFFAALLLLTLSSLVYKNKNKDTDVLGASTTNEVYDLEKFLAYNPDYLPGWVEVYKLSKDYGYKDIETKALNEIKRIDPNYKLEQ